MDFVKILKRSWNILWRYRALWLFGILLALTAAGGMRGGGGGSSYQFGSQDEKMFQSYGDWFHGFQPGWDQTANFGWVILAAVIGLVVVSILVAVIFTFLRYISITSLIRMVDKYEEKDERCTVKQGFRLGWSKASWRIFLIDLVINIPLTLIVMVLMFISLSPLLLWFTGDTATGIIGTILAVGLFFAFILVMIVVSAAVRIFTQFFHRAAALQNLGVFESIRTGYGLVRRNLSNAILMWLILVAVQIAYGIITAILGIVLFVIILPLGIIPGLAAGGIGALFGSGPLPWIMGLMVAMLFIFLILSLPFLFLGGLKEVFLSTAWTLTFRQFSGLSGSTVTPEPPADNEGITEIPSQDAEEIVDPQQEDLP